MKWLFATLFFFVPLILWPYSSEVFEFNKTVFVYGMTTIITALWLYRSISAGKIIFCRTILDIPIILFLTSQLISTIVSIDPLTSVFGYYSRFNGGLLSTLCYSFLYWAFVSNMTKSYTVYAIRSILASAVLVSIYGVLEHFGIDKNVWVQDVQSRIFSTLGQPNWLAAWLVAIIPITWFFSLEKKKFWLYFFGSLLFFIVILFTKSRSGLAGFVITDFIFWGYTLLKFKKGFLKEFLIFNISFLVLFLVIKSPITRNQSPSTSGPALETGGTESGTIRKIVWKGAVQVWLHNPVFGTGPETFAYSYFLYRPIEHNQTSEWNFVYNKAHNEYLNIAANTGSFGLLSYLGLIIFSIFIFLKTKNYYLLAGYTGLAITNFFGFSVVPTQLEFFLFPAIAIALWKNS